MAIQSIGGYPYQQWRASLRQASFRGVPFYVQQNAKKSGRRTALHAFPKNDTPYAEDMGRRGYQILVTGYIVGPTFFSGTYQTDRDNIENALEDSLGQGPGTLIMPLRGVWGRTTNLFTCPNYTTVEREVWGGYAEIEMIFVEYGTPGLGAPTVAAPAAVTSASTNAANTAVQNFNFANPSTAPP
jgi:prophage DNA circulation protein